MFCGNCGTELPDEANFCLKCGKPQKPGVLVEESKWELCEIEHRVVKSSLFSAETLVFEAKAIGPKGKYIAARSKAFKHTGSKKWSKVLNAFINDLSKDGWELVPGSGGSYSLPQFRRRIK